MDPNRLAGLAGVDANLGYVSDDDGTAIYRVWPPVTGRQPESPVRRGYPMPIHDCRPLAAGLSLADDGFVFREHRTGFSAFFDEARVKSDYYPEMAEWLRALSGAKAAYVFDHNVRSVRGAASGQLGVRAPVDMVHADYTDRSGPRRAREVLAAHGVEVASTRRLTLVNIWRPLHGPVLDLPLAVCHPHSVATGDLVETPIEHYSEGDLARPSHVGEILSVRHSSAHRWFYAPAMQANEVLAFKGHDSAGDPRTACVPHTGFVHPACPAQYEPRESIELRVLLVDAVAA